MGVCGGRVESPAGPTRFTANSHAAQRMALSLTAQRSVGVVSRRLTRQKPWLCVLRGSSLDVHPQSLPRRTFLSWLKKPKTPSKFNTTKPPEPILTEDNLFHPFSKSPFPAIRARGEAIQQLAPCPVCAAAHRDHAHAHAQPKAVKFECPDCGWPTHCSEEHWHADEDHGKYCGRLREVNEDEHDLRSGRRLREFELPGTCFPWGLSAFTREVTSYQVHRIRKRLYHSQTGICSGIREGSPPWTQTVRGDTLANS